MNPARLKISGSLHISGDTLLPFFSSSSHGIALRLKFALNSSLNVGIYTSSTFFFFHNTSITKRTSNKPLCSGEKGKGALVMKTLDS